MLYSQMQNRRNKAAAKKFMNKQIKKQGFAPRVMVTDKLICYGAAKKEILPTVEHRYSQGLEQPSRKLAPTDTAEGEKDAAV